MDNAPGIRSLTLNERLARMKRLLDVHPALVPDSPYSVPHEVADYLLDLQMLSQMLVRDIEMAPDEWARQLLGSLSPSERVEVALAVYDAVMLGMGCIRSEQIEGADAGETMLRRVDSTRVEMRLAGQSKTS